MVVVIRWSRRALVQVRIAVKSRPPFGDGRLRSAEGSGVPVHVGPAQRTPQKAGGPPRFRGQLLVQNSTGTGAALL